MKDLLLRGVLAAVLSVPVAAHAQDVVVMRRSVAPANLAAHSWKTGDWVAQPSCSSKAPATRTVTCVRNSDDAAVADDLCLSTRKPETSGTTEDRRACTYDWNEGGWGGWSPSTCARGATRSQTVTCMRLGDAEAEEADSEARCLAVRAKPQTSDAGDVFSGCSYQWVRTGGACDGKSGFRIDTYGCQRSGGSVTTEVVSDAYSVERCGEKPVARVEDLTCGAGGALKNGDFEKCDATGWTSGGGALNIETGANAIGGACSVSITQNYYSNNYLMRQYVTLEQGRKYRLTFRHKAQVASNNTSQGAWVYLNGFTADIAIVQGRPAGKYPSYTQPAVYPEYGWAIVRSGTTVETAAVTFTATANGGVIEISNNNDGSITIDDVSLFPEP